MVKRRNFTDQFKAKVALEALRGDKTVQEIAAKHQLHPNQVSTWKRQAIDEMADMFSGGNQSDAGVKDIHAKIGRLAVENYFCRKGSKGEPGKETINDPARHPKLSISQSIHIC